MSGFPRRMFPSEQIVFSILSLYISKSREVPVGEASVVIAVSSAHRREALAAVEFGIDELKATVPIWKKASRRRECSAFYT